jgi:hypothetical protein
MDGGRISEDQAAPYPVYFERVTPKNSKNARYWILYTEHPSISELDFSLRTPSGEKGGSLKVREPVALLRDDNFDSFPDLAFLFRADREDPDVLSFGEFSRKGCEFWRRPVSSFLREALEHSSWHMGLARRHSWISFLEKLSMLEPIKNFPIQNSLSVLNEFEAHQLFELLTYATLTFSEEGRESEPLFERTQARTEKVLSWLGLRYEFLRAPASQKAIWVEGVREPLRFHDYGAPFLYVQKNGQTEKAVFDVLLFNDWTTEGAWSRRIVQSSLK